MSRLHRVLGTGPGDTCVVRDLDGRVRRVSLVAYDGEPPLPGGWVVVHSGYALAPVAPEEADAVLRTMAPADGAGGEVVDR